MSALPVLLLAAILALPACAWAQGGANPIASAAPAAAKSAAVNAASASTDPTDIGLRDPDAIAKDLAAAREALKVIEASPGNTAGAPPDTPASELAERLSLARQLATAYQQQQDLLKRAEAARSSRAETERAGREWSGFAKPPPYSVLTLDALRDRVQAADTELANAESRVTLLGGFIESMAPKVKTNQAAARLAAEAADHGRGTPNEARLEWQRTLATLRARADIATQDLLQISRRTAREDGARAAAAGELAQRQLAAAGNEVTLNADDLARVEGEIAARRRALEGMIADTAKASTATSDVRAAAEAALATARAATADADADPAANAVRDAALERNLEIARARAEAAGARLDLLKGTSMALDGEQAAWRVRAEAIAARDPVRARALYDRLTTATATIGAWREYLQQQIGALQARIVEQEARLRSGNEADAAQAQQLLATLRQRDSDLRRALEGGQPLERLLARFREEFEGRREGSLQERARDGVARILLVARRVWNFELFSVADTFETADGRRIDVERSVTIGKSVGAFLVLLGGYWIASVVMRRVERRLVAKGKLPEQSARLLRSWILFCIGAALILFALVSASIPLTAFAFLGGALAIAAGFGLQTLLKNFVAGVMLLFERPMRLGDLVEVDGVRGRVSSIGIRASTITSADGVETMIPNSAFVENKLTNWTYSSPEARQTLTISVAYGTPLRRASDVLLDALGRHGLVLKSPAPQVYVDAFADSSVDFALMYWLDMRPGVDSRRVKSDLLQMIDAAFTDAKIGMPFPQRDVHLDTNGPLRVEVVTPPKADGGTN